MSELSPADLAAHSKRLQANLQAVAAALAGTSLDTLAQAISKEDTQVSRIRSGQLGATIPDVIRLLHAAGMKCVPADRVCVDRATYEAMSTIASKAMADPETVRRLTRDE